MEIRFKPSSLLARIVADITGDGHLQYDGIRGNIFFYSKYLKFIKLYEKRFYRQFKIKGKIRKKFRFTWSYGLFFSSKRIASFLYSVGAPPGNKANSIFYVPKWIFNGSKNIKRAYLKGIYSSEGSVYPTKVGNKNRWRIEIEQYKRLDLKDKGIIFMNQIKKMLEDFSIISSPVRFGKKQKRDNGVITIAIKLDIEKKYFKNFYKEIGFDNIIKMKRLLLAMRDERG